MQLTPKLAAKRISERANIPPEILIPIVLALLEQCKNKKATFYHENAISQPLMYRLMVRRIVQDHLQTSRGEAERIAHHIFETVAQTPKDELESLFTKPPNPGV